jgi:phage tail sheath gpL-like
MGVDVSAVARVLGITTQFKDLRGGSVVFLPQRIALIGQGATASTYSLTKFQITSAAQAGARYGYGSPIHLAARELFPSNGDGVGTIPVTVYPLDDDGSGVAATGDITLPRRARRLKRLRIRSSSAALSPKSSRFPRARSRARFFTTRCERWVRR